MENKNLLFPLIGGLLTTAGISATTNENNPNVIIIFMDDMGRSDIPLYGGKVYTPHINQLVKEGMSFTDFCVASSVSTPSRAALLTGCYPGRVGLTDVLFPRDSIGLNENEQIIPELLKQKGYYTACVGKWHLGHRTGALPTAHGFDEYYGLPYSNDMKPLPMLENTTSKYEVTTQDLITTEYTEKCVNIINKHKDKPFFLYLAHTMPHIPLGVSEKFKNKSGVGIYGDVVMEIDWSIGEIQKALKENHLSDNTLIIFTSDNGPWLTYGNHAGNSFPLNNGKFSFFEGGFRSFCVIAWPEFIEKGSRCDKFCSSLDILPTLAEITGAELSTNKIDGKSFLNYLKDPLKATPIHDYYYYLKGTKVMGIRKGEWKLMFPQSYGIVVQPGQDGKPGQTKQVKIEQPALFNLKDDIGEECNLADKHPQLVLELELKAKAFEAQLINEKRHPGVY